jgi:hypothetical protein
VFWPLGQALIDAYGWRTTALIFGALHLVICVPLHLALLPRGAALPADPPEQSSSHSLGDALRTPAFYLLAAAFTFNALVFSAMMIHLLAMIVAKGLTAAQAAALGALVGPMQVAGRLAEMTVGQRITPATVGVIACGLLPASILLLALSEPSWPNFLLFALLFGASNGVMTIVRGTIPVEFYGRAHYGAVNGALAAPVLTAKAVGPLVAALAWAGTRDYDSVALMLAATGLCSLAFLALAMRWRRN